MKTLKLAFVFFLFTALSSCVDTEEKIVLNANNSGTYSMAVDLSAMLKMAASMGGDKSITDKLNEKIDTTIYLKDLVNKEDNLTAREKDLYRNGQVHIKLDGAGNEMNVLISSPFKNTADLTEIKNNFPVILDKLKALEKATGEKERPEEENADMKLDAKSANPVADQFTFIATAGKISNTVIDIDAFKKKIAEDSILVMMSQMAGVMGDLNYRTIITLPVAVKNHQGPASIISGDKKTITFYTTLAEMMEHPEKASYKVEY